MRKKFEQIKDRPQFFIDVAVKFGSNPDNVRNNWFNHMLFKIPKRDGLYESLEKFIDAFIKTEKETEAARKQIRQKNLGL